MPHKGFKHSEESKRKISIAAKKSAIKLKKEGRGGFNVKVNCPHCGQEMSPANLAKHQEPCLNSRGRFLNGKELSVNEIKRLRIKLRQYDLSVDDYLALNEKQGGKCGICRNHPKPPRERLSVDHCHEFGQIRGLLCSRCNYGIGQFEHSVELLREAIIYLEGPE